MANFTEKEILSNEITKAVFELFYKHCLNSGELATKAITKAHTATNDLLDNGLGLKSVIEKLP